MFNYEAILTPLALGDNVLFSFSVLKALLLDELRAYNAAHSEHITPELLLRRIFKLGTLIAEDCVDCAVQELPWERPSLTDPRFLNCIARDLQIDNFVNPTLVALAASLCINIVKLQVEYPDDFIVLHGGALYKAATKDIKPAIKSHRIENFILDLLKIQNLNHQKIDFMIRHSFPELTTEQQTRAFKNLVVTLSEILALIPNKQRGKRVHQLLRDYLQNDLANPRMLDASWLNVDDFPQDFVTQVYAVKIRVAVQLSIVDAELEPETSRADLVAQEAEQHQARQQERINQAQEQAEAERLQRAWDEWVQCPEYPAWCAAVQENAVKMAALREKYKKFEDIRYDAPPLDRSLKHSISVRNTGYGSGFKNFKTALVLADIRLQTPHFEIMVWLGDFFGKAPIEKLKSFRIEELPAPAPPASPPAPPAPPPAAVTTPAPLNSGINLNPLWETRSAHALRQFNNAYRIFCASSTFQSPTYQNSNGKNLDERLRNLFIHLVNEGNNKNHNMVIPVAKAFTTLINEMSANTLTEARANQIIGQMHQEYRGGISKKVKLAISLALTALCATLGFFFMGGPVGAAIAGGSAAVVTGVASCCFWKPKSRFMTLDSIDKIRSAEEGFKPFYNKSF